MGKEIKIWYDKEGDYLEFLFERKKGYFVETENDAVMKKVDEEGNVIGFYILKVSALKEKPLSISLKNKVEGKRKPTKVDYVYELFKEELEKEHFGKIVAIDTELKKIVGIGDTVLEAYRQAKKNTGKDQFDFRRVGYSYIHRV